MVNVQGDNKNYSVTVQGGINAGSIQTTNNMAEFWSDIAKQWAVSDKLVQGIDYSAKHYAEESKTSLEKTKIFIEENLDDSVQSAKKSIEETAGDYNTQLTNAGDTIINAINSTRADSVSAVEEAGATSLLQISSARTAALNDISSSGNSYLQDFSIMKNETKDYANRAKSSADIAIEYADKAVETVNKGIGPASNTKLGGVIVGDGLRITTQGVLSSQRVILRDWSEE